MKTFTIEQARSSAAYDKWFRGRVEEEIKEADDPSTVWATHAEVKQDLATQRKALQAKIAPCTL